MKPLIKKINGVWSVVKRDNIFTDTNMAALYWCHNRNIQERNYRVKTKTS
jgi:hypothetical protein